MDMPVRDDYVREEIMQVGRTPLRVAIRPGSGTAPPLLLCNGLGMPLEAWRPFVDALDPAIEVIRFDTPGAGGSQLPKLPYRFTTLALLLREMLHKLGHQQADVLGISWGGRLAQQFALHNPGLCRRLILVATAGFTTLPLLPLIRQRTLVLTGDRDPIVPVANGRILAAGIPDATLHVYHGGHIKMVTRPRLLTPMITSFLAS
jgi:pimeloyl-ACP methyl ester carboxylesterase